MAGELSQNNAGSWNEKQIAAFTRNLKQVISWTKKLSSKFDFENGFYGKVFRKTNPVVGGQSLYCFDGDYATWNLRDDNQAIYYRLLQRAVEVRDIQADELAIRDLTSIGKILSFETCNSTHDGAPIVESACFVDESDVPPIDTWFFLKNNYRHGKARCKQALFCWVPKEFERKMQAAIDVEILDSYRWLHLNDPVMYQKVQNL